MCWNPQREIKRVRQDLMTSFRETLPAKQFSETILLAVVALHLIAAEVQETRSLEERRRLLDEFSKRKSVIEKGIRLLRETKTRKTERTHTAEQQVLP